MPISLYQDGRRFRVRQHIYSNRDSSAYVLTGEFEPQGTRTRIAGVLDLEVTSKIAICPFIARPSSPDSDHHVFVRISTRAISRIRLRVWVPPVLHAKSRARLRKKSRE